MISIHLLLVGSELLDLKRDDKNGKFLSRLLGERNLKFSQIDIVDDDEKKIAAAFTNALSQADVVISSGGIGPTGDDLTREGLAQALCLPLVEDKDAMASIAEKIKKRGKELKDFEHKMAFVPPGSQAIPNNAGLAAGIFAKIENRMIFVLPGVPREFEEMAKTFVMKEINSHYKIKKTLTVNASLAGIRESEVQEFLSEYDNRKGLKYSILPHYGFLEVSFLLEGETYGAKDKRNIEKALEAKFPQNLISLEGKNLVQVLAEEINKRKFSLSVAESLTGGTISKKIVSLPGASAFYKGGVTAYSDEAKMDILGIHDEVIKEHGAVSEETALAMARGARARFLSSCAVATTGIAGPSGETRNKPAGLVYIAVSKPHKEEVYRFVFPLDRDGVIEMTANYALFHVIKLLRDED